MHNQNLLIILCASIKLNSKSFFTLGGTHIPENADMNNYTEPGNYSLDVGSYLTSIKNAPKMNYAFDLNVGRALGDYTAQIFREYVTGNIAYRIYRVDHWEDYRYFKSESDAFTTTLTNKSSKTTTSAIIEVYNKIKDDLWKTWENGTFIKTADINGPRYCAIGYKVDDNFGAFIMLYYAYDRPLYVRVSSGVWDVDNPKNI